MDPYIEQRDFWADFHNDLAAEIRAQLNQQIQPKYFARNTRYVTYDVLEIDSRAALDQHGIYPDIGVWHAQPAPEYVPTTTATITPAPVESMVVYEIPFRQHNVEIRATETKALVMVIEILSPVNKRPGHEAFQEYQRKRRDILRSPVHLLEIDLLRAGARPPLERPVPPAPYYVVLSRATRRPTVEVWPIQLADPLPVLPVPLLEPDPDAVLALGALVASVYERGAYGAEIDYRQPAPPPLSDDEAAWVDELLRRSGRR
jgi:hypothetical protein